MLPRQSYFASTNSQAGFFSVAALLVLITLAAAVYILAGQLKNPTSWISKAEGEPTTCTGKLAIPSCYDDGTPTAIQVNWSAPKNPDRDCNVYLNGADPASQEVVSTGCSGSKTYTYTTDRLLGNPLGNQDIYQLGIDNGTTSCTIKQVDEIRAESACQGKKTAGPKPVPPSATEDKDCTAQIQSDFGITFTNFTKQSCTIYQQLKNIDAKYTLVAILRDTKVEFKRVDSLTPGQSVCQTHEVVLPDNFSTTQIQAKMLGIYAHNLLNCQPDKNNLWRDANNAWSEYGGITPATYNPKPLKASPQSPNGCTSRLAKLDRSAIGDIVNDDYIAALASLVDPNFLKNFKPIEDLWCTDQYPFANKANAPQCQIAERVLLKTGQASICGQITNPQTNGNTEFGMQINMEPIKDPGSGKFLKGYPTQSEMDLLSPKWIRYVYHQQYGLAPLSNVNHLVIFNNESAPPAPIGSSSESDWNNYIDKTYIPTLSRFLDSKPSINAVEIWNEPDLCDKGGSYCPYIPPRSFASLLKKASSLIKQKSPQLTVVSGGLASGQTTYVSQMKQADSGVFSQVDALGIHPYGKSPQGFSISGQFRLQSGDLESSYKEYAAASGLTVWATEVGFNASDQKWQADYLTKLFQVTQQASPRVPVLIWYSWTDRFRSKSPYTWGLVEESGNLKQSGKAFQGFAKGGQ